MIKTVTFTVVKIYTVERSENLPIILDYLKNEANTRGVTVYRGMSAFGGDGTRATSLMDLSFSLPLIIEFFDYPERISIILDFLKTVVKSEHLFFFTAEGFHTE